MNGERAKGNGRPRVGDKAFLWLVLAISICFVWIIAPLYGAILWGIVLAILFEPLHRALRNRIGRPNLTAAMTLLAIIIIVVAPLIIIITAVAVEATAVYEKIQAGHLDLGAHFQKIFDSMPAWAANLLDRAGLSTLSELKMKISDSVAKAGQFVVVQAISVGQNTFSFLLNLFVMLYLLFFLLRDGDSLYARIKRAIPLRLDQKETLFAKFGVVIRATVKGNMVVALLQGGLGGLIFWILGLQAPLLWGTLMALLSLLPAVGAAMVWFPVAIYLLATGAVGRGMVLLVFGAVVISLVDNLVRPMLVGKDTKMPDYIVLISTLGGIAVFGVNGFILGPVIAALFMAVWDMFSQKAPETSIEPNTIST